MPVILNADSGAISGISGLTTSADNSGVLQFQSSGTATLEISTTGNINIPGTGKRITGDFSNATIANRVAFQTSTTNGNTIATLIPNGTSTISQFQAFGGSDVDNTSQVQFANVTNNAVIAANRTGTGTFGNIVFNTSGSERLRIDTSGNVGVNTSNPGAFAKFVVLQTSDSNAFQIATTTNGAGMYWIPTNSFGVQQYSYGGLLAIGTADSNLLSLRTNATERMRIDSSGNLLIGQSVDNFPGAGNTITGGGITASGRISFSAASATVAYFNRNTDNGELVSFRRQGNGVGAINATTTGVTLTGTNGITFTATQSASADANTLDDYEEGTWTPQLQFNGSATGMTYAKQIGRYTKIGRIVSLQFNIKLSNKGSSTGTATLVGTPFPGFNGPSNNAPMQNGFVVNEIDGSSWPAAPYGLIWDDSRIYLRFNSGSGIGELTSSNFTNSTEFYYSCTYEIA